MERTRGRSSIWYALWLYKPFGIGYNERCLNGKGHKENMKIAFLGDESCVGAGMLALALTIYRQEGKSILMADADFASSRLEDAFSRERNVYVKEESYYGIREGMDYFLYRMEHGGCTPSVVKEGVTYLTENFAYVRAAFWGKETDYLRKMKKYARTFLEQWNRAFDLVMMAGERDAAGCFEEIRGCCDACVLCLEYDGIWRNLRTYERILQESHCYVLIGRVVGDFGEIRRQIVGNFRVSEDRFAFLPYNSYYEMRLSQGNLYELFASGGVKRGLFPDFLAKMERTSQCFMRWLEEMADNDGKSE